MKITEVWVQRLVCAIIYDKQVVVANVGDSRAYVINQRQMDQITSDHSFLLIT